MTYEEILALIKDHTRYDTKCECGEFLLKRVHGFLSSRDQYELHLAEVLYEDLGR
jgi:hypothetical protein